MANVKDIEIVARVPFDWCLQLTDHESRLFLGLLGPTHGLSLRYEDKRYAENRNGGKTASYVLTISGQEAMSSSAVNSIAAALSRVGLSLQVPGIALGFPIGLLRVMEYDLENHVPVTEKNYTAGSAALARQVAIAEES